jgi:hypothetical protein
VIHITSSTVSGDGLFALTGLHLRPGPPRGRLRASYRTS